MLDDETTEGIDEDDDGGDEAMMWLIEGSCEGGIGILVTDGAGGEERVEGTTIGDVGEVVMVADNAGGGPLDEVGLEMMEEELEAVKEAIEVVTTEEEGFDSLSTNISEGLVN